MVERKDAILIKKQNWEHQVSENKHNCFYLDARESVLLQRIFEVHYNVFMDERLCAFERRECKGVRREFDEKVTSGIHVHERQRSARR